ncbi:ActS/PrrB/RegB family redox-sensitive histidine kinase [Candidatus Puniceispirillum sp.]|nr:ActS/PrrB/RegB family redox-sensitive histidine kinase [Candidatus Puniceispirillum sp.]
MPFLRSDKVVESDFHSPIEARVILNIRWVAIFGQVTAIACATFFLQLELPLLPALVVISLSVFVNLWQNLNVKISHHQHRHNSMALGFDVVQLAGLLYLTGGLLNPFSVMILAPVVVSAAVLRRKSTLILIGLVAASVSFLALFNHPINWQKPVQLPPYYLAGVWMALTLSTCFLGGYVWWVASSARRLSATLADAKLAVIEEQQVRALGSLATAAAHKLGSPLNTITVISHELLRDITPDDPIYEDIQLLRAEIERCRVILSELDVVQGRRAIADEPPVPITLIIDEVIYQRVSDDGINFIITHDAKSDQDVPKVTRRPEWVHALENLLQNAKQFALKQVHIHIAWEGDNIKIVIRDDGAGFSPGILAQAGQPWNSSRIDQEGHRGLGLFIARTLIESIGGSVHFGNFDEGGARVELKVPQIALAF